MIKNLIKCNEDGVAEWCIAESKEQAYELMSNTWGQETMDNYQNEFKKDNPKYSLNEFIEYFFTEENPEEDFTLDSEEGVITKKISEWLDEETIVPCWFACENY